MVAWLTSCVVCGYLCKRICALHAIFVMHSTLGRVMVHFSKDWVFVNAFLPFVNGTSYERSELIVLTFGHVTDVM